MRHSTGGQRGDSAVRVAGALCSRCDSGGRSHRKLLLLLLLWLLLWEVEVQAIMNHKVQAHTQTEQAIIDLLRPQAFKPHASSVLFVSDFNSVLVKQLKVELTAQSNKQNINGHLNAPTSRKKNLLG